MKLLIDTEARTLSVDDQGPPRQLDLYGAEAFDLLSREWVRLGWNLKHTYTFAWLGRPIIQLPHDMIRLQEVIFQLRPTVIIETGVAHGGSLVYYAGLCKILGNGRVIGVDIEIRPHNRQAIEQHFLSDWITLIEGNSVAPETVDRVKALIQPDDRVLVLLDSNHTRQHVLDELEAYCSLVTPGSYIVATDGIMQWLTDVPRGNPTWETDNPSQAAVEFATAHPEFELGDPAWPFNESPSTVNVTHWPQAWLRRRSDGATPR